MATIVRLGLIPPLDGKKDASREIVEVVSAIVAVEDAHPGIIAKSAGAAHVSAIEVVSGFEGAQSPGDPLWAYEHMGGDVQHQVVTTSPELLAKPLGKRSLADR